ncbi:unnamed protein product [Rodentolepis nana]|uniref:RING-type E3 ubiquitin transferase n=1 Tax=Rodentolepis nana TaxID=102285 RepID=A0A0R3T9D5_RODNA|nr:unnamed protein product [Rodentolepis nana]
MARKVQISLENFKEISSCNVCFSTVKDPWTLPCGHFFCYDPCLTGLIKHQLNKCPTCRKTFHHTQVNPFYFFRDFIQKAKLDGEVGDDREGDMTVKEIMGESWTTRKAPSPPPLDYEIDRPPLSEESYEAERLAFLMSNDPTFIPVSQRPPENRRCPRWPVCDGRNCPHIHPNRLCMDLLCPGGEVCDLVHADTFINLLQGGDSRN